MSDGLASRCMLLLQKQKGLSSNILLPWKQWTHNWYVMTTMVMMSGLMLRRAEMKVEGLSLPAVPPCAPSKGGEEEEPREPAHSR